MAFLAGGEVEDKQLQKPILLIAEQQASSIGREWSATQNWPSGNHLLGGAPIHGGNP
jgi:hypothetical protein